jgi:adenylate cyclase
MFMSYFKTHLLKPLILALVVGMAGVVINLAPLGSELEENLGLDLLFTLRGIRQPPTDVVVVSIDRESADELGLPDDPRKWPRSIHARLIENLSLRGASVIAFDVNFTEKSSATEDNLLAETMRKYCNTVLCEAMKLDSIPDRYTDSLKPQETNILKIMTPAPPLLQAAAAAAPFPLPRVPNKLSQYWTFTTLAGDKPTLPVVAFQIFTMKIYDEFIHLLKTASPEQASKLPLNKDRILNSRSIEKRIADIKHIFQNTPFIAEKMLEELQKSKMRSVDEKKYQMISSLIDMYRKDANSRYLNFYGPARTINTIPYSQILRPADPAVTNKFDMKNKAVFVGLSQLSPIDQKEGFFTVYSRKDGLNISGVEIAATAFANLVENMPILPVNFRLYITIIFIWGMALGFISKRFSIAASFYGMTGMCATYLFFAAYQFKNSGIWYPIISPLFLQPVLAFSAGIIWNYITVKQERQNIRKALGFYLPDEIADRLARNAETIHSSHQIVFGVCLSTDAEHYSSLSEAMGPEELGNFMNRYYEAIFGPVKQHGGTVSDVVGDSMLAVWISPDPEAVLKHNACLAALDISKAIQKFNVESDKLRLPTRIGLHCGYILVGNIGAINHYEYRPVGDIVNTATRIEELNKYLETRILATKEVITGLEAFQTREIGEFRLAGKTKPVKIYELGCRLEECDDNQMMAYAIFDWALNAFRNQSWDEAMEGFYYTIEILGADGPSEFYIKLCKENKAAATDQLWDGVVHMGKK